MVQQVGKTEAASLIETAKRVIVEEGIIKFASAVCLSQVCIFSVTLSLPVKNLCFARQSHHCQCFVFSGLYTDFQMISVFIYPEQKDCLDFLHPSVYTQNSKCK